MNGLQLVAPADATGYATVAASFGRILLDAGATLTWQPLVRGRALGLGYEPGVGETGPPELRPHRRPLPHDTVLMVTVPEYFPLLGGAAARKVGATIWETDRLPAHWPSLVAALDAVIVPSEWNREVFLSSGVSTPVFVVPHPSQFEGRAADPRRVAAWRDAFGLNESATTVFYTIGAWTTRKGVATTIDAFCRAFDADDDVMLVVKTGRTVDVGTRWRDSRGEPTADAVPRLLRRHKAPPRVVLIDSPLAVEDVHALHAFADCYVSLSRAEGWGLGAYEAAWAGRPVVATDHEGHRSFLSSGNAWLVGARRVRISRERGWGSYGRGQHWWEPDVGAAVAALRAVAADPIGAHERAASLRGDVQSRFSALAIRRALLGALEGSLP